MKENLRLIQNLPAKFQYLVVILGIQFNDEEPRIKECEMI